MQAQHTLKATLQESLWRQDQDRQTRYIAAQEAARAFAFKVRAVSARYAFAPAHDLFRFTTQGVCTQAALTLTDTDGHRLTVIAKLDEAGDELVYQEAVSELLDAYEEYGRFDGASAANEQTAMYRMADAAANNSWAALTAVIDTYVARRIGETLTKL